MNNTGTERLIVTDLVSTLNRILELQDMISNNERERERLLREVEMGSENELVFEKDRISVTRQGTEEEGYNIAKFLGADYVLVIFGGLTNFSGDDISKFIWMIRIAGKTTLPFLICDCSRCLLAS